VTQEGLTAAIAEGPRRGPRDRGPGPGDGPRDPARMEEEAERFGRAVGLDSASTFECIVEGPRHYFMEVNTRIQVEHRVSELCYALRFANPDDADDAFDVRSLVEAMALLARHGARLPEPSGCAASGPAVEARLNATDRALQPHAGGVIANWSRPGRGRGARRPGHLREEPRHRALHALRLAGAYDSNIALLVTTGDDRAGVLRGSRRCSAAPASAASTWRDQPGVPLRPGELVPRRNVYAKPTTRFVVPYLTLVGLLKEASSRIDLAAAWTTLARAREGQPTKEGAMAVREDASPARRPSARAAGRQLFETPTCTGGVALHQPATASTVVEGRVRVAAQPRAGARRHLPLLDMDWRRGMPPAHVIWDHDHALLQRGPGDFYDAPETGPMPWTSALWRSGCLPEPVGASTRPPGRAPGRPTRVSSGRSSCSVCCPSWGAYGLLRAAKVNDDLTIARARTCSTRRSRPHGEGARAPPPATKADEVVAEVGGMFYAQEAPTAALRQGGPPLREGPDALHHRGDEDVQPGAGALRGHASTRCWWRAPGPSCTRARASFA
jgi:hypothetical protein